MDALRPLSGFSAASPSSPRFPTSNKTPDSGGKRTKNKIPEVLRPKYVLGTIGGMVFLAAAIEIALFFSNRHGGFSMGKDTERVQWLSGFLPTLAIGPLVWIWKRTDRDMKKLQPYVVLSQGPAKAEESVLMDLEHRSIFHTMKTAFNNGYILIIGSTAIALLNILFHPLAGSFFLVRQSKTTHSSDDFAKSTATIGLNPSYKDITSFVAAAGFADAAAFHNLSDPPFVMGPWAVAEFKFPIDVTQNSSVAVRTVGVQTNVSCSASGTFSLTPNPSSLNWTLTASLPARGSGCTVTQSIDSTAALSQYGVEPVPSCADSAATRDNPFSPVLFWYFNTPPSGTPVGSAVFCAPTIAVRAVEAVVDGTTGLLVNVTVTGDIDRTGNNVTGGGFAGRSFNGVSFDSGSDFNLTNSFVRARALAVQSGIPGAIFRFASDPTQGGGLTAAFANSTGFLGLTEKIYTQYMSIVALSNYFVLQEASVDAKVTLWPNRLWINPVTAHCFVALLLIIAITGGAIHYVHMRQRKNLYLASRPGSIAHYMSILSDPQLAALTSRDQARAQSPSVPVGPMDDKRSMNRKLGGLQFVLDPQTGSVVPVYSDRWRKSRGVGSGGRRASAMSGHEYEMEDPSKALLGPEYRVERYRDPFDHKSPEP